MIDGGTRQRRERISRSPDFWLLYPSCEGPARPLSLELPGGGEAVAVFSGEGEASVFAMLATAGGSWKTRETSTGEIVSLLYGPFSGARAVALDPSPEMLDEGLLGLVTLDRWRFIRRFASPEAGRRAAVRAPARGSAQTRR